jgi:hypothetical protein
MNKTDAIKEVLRISINRYVAEVDEDQRNLRGMSVDNFRKSVAAAREFLASMKDDEPPEEKRCGTCAHWNTENRYMDSYGMGLCLETDKAASDWKENMVGGSCPCWKAKP